MAVKSILLIAILVVSIIPITLIDANGQAKITEIPIISTRGTYDGDGDLKPGKRAENYTINGNIQGLKGPCPEEIVIYIHGVWNSESDAKDNVNQFNKVLKSKSYNHQVIGYSWDSDTDTDAIGIIIDKDGFNDARKAGISNGKALAKFILDYNAKCNNTKIRIVSHSLGAAVVLSTIAELDNKNKKKVIESVDMFGPAVDNEEIQKGTAFASSNNIGKAIENVVKSMYVYWSAEDDVFSGFYWTARKDQALGENSIEDYSKKPTNVTIINAQNELSADIDGDGKPNSITGAGIVLYGMGDHHSGYSGIVSKDEIITDDGAIDIAYDHWLSKSGKSYIKVTWNALAYEGDDIGNDYWYFYFTVNSQKTDWYSEHNQINNGKVYFSNGTKIPKEPFEPSLQTEKIIYIKECKVGKEVKLNIDITAYLDETLATDDQGTATKTISPFCKDAILENIIVIVDVTEPGGLFSDKTAKMWFTLKIESIGKPAYNLTLLEDDKQSDGTINLGESVRVVASTNDDSIKDVKFRWIDPNNIEISNTKSISNAEDKYTPNKPGSWTVIAEFDDGIEIIKSIDVSFMVLPESTIGAIGVIGASIVAFMLYARRK